MITKDTLIDKIWEVVGPYYLAPPFRAEERAALESGWQYREDYGPCPPVAEWFGSAPSAEALGLYQDERCRLAWELGWGSKNGDYYDVLDF